MSFLRNGKERDMVPCLICSVGQSRSTRDIHMAECAKIFHISKTNLKKIIEREEPKKSRVFTYIIDYDGKKGIPCQILNRD
jgi:hypothetical protein